MKEDHVRGRLYFNGINTSYGKWIWHKENACESFPNKRVWKEYISDEFEDHPVDIVNDVQENVVNHPEEFVKLLEEEEKPLYPESKITKLSFLVLYNLKAQNGWSDNGFSQLPLLLGEVFPKNNNILTSMYGVKKTLRSLGMDYQKIHACLNNCILYRKEFENASSCPVCNCSRWKVIRPLQKRKRGSIPTKVLYYIPPISRFNACIGI